MIIQGGDIINGNGSGGDSIYGKKFMDENYKHRHDKGYLVAMANCGEKDTNSSQFYITLDETPWLDDFHVVFGSVISGFKVIDRIAKLGKQDSTVTKKSSGTAHVIEIDTI